MADAVLPDDVIEEVENHISRQNCQNDVSHRFSRIAEPKKLFKLSFNNGFETNINWW